MTEPTSGAGTNPMAIDYARDRRRASLEAIVMAVACMATVGAGVAGVWRSSEAAIRENYQHYLMGLALAVSQQIEPGLHGRIRDPRQIDGLIRAGGAAAAFRDAIPDVKFVYTVVRDGDQVRFVLDAAEPGDHDGDGVEDRSGIWELYDDADVSMFVALGDRATNGEPATTGRPYTDRWGTFMSAYAPFFDEAGHEAGVVGVDVDANVYIARLGRAHDAIARPARGQADRDRFAFYASPAHFVSNRGVTRCSGRGMQPAIARSGCAV
jgi:hypothetical protein